MDIAPPSFPVRVNGGFREKTADKVVDPLFAKALALADGEAQVVLCVVDTCMMPRDLIDRAKAMVRDRAGLPRERILISATHTHSAPAAMGCLGSRADPAYVEFLPGRLADAVVGALERLEPAEIGWASVDDWEHTFNRRWIRRPDKLIRDPYGQDSARAHMHPGHLNPDAISPSGPVDPELSVLVVRRPGGAIFGALANYSQHYYGAGALSSDYFGYFGNHLRELLGGDDSFVGMMSQGTSGDLHWMDYGAPRNRVDISTYAHEVAKRAREAVDGIAWKSWVPLKMAETRLPLNYRVPDADRLAWARRIAGTLGDRLPGSWPEVYALEAIHLHERQATDVVLQALRIGELTIHALPNEVYALTGLKLKALTPSEASFNIELANGADGYIPPPEQHVLGGYTTWPARTAGLEVEAEPKIVEALLTLAEEVSGKPRREVVVAHGAYAKAVLKDRPKAYWKFDEMVIPEVTDASGHGTRAMIEGGVALYLPGVGSGHGVTPRPALTASAFFGAGRINRSFHFAGGRVVTEVQPGKTFSLELWFWNGFSGNAPAATGTLASLGSDLEIGLQSVDGSQDTLVVKLGDREMKSQAPALKVRGWHHLVLVGRKQGAQVFLDGEVLPELAGGGGFASGNRLILGGAEQTSEGFLGRMDEVAWYDVALGADAVREHWRASGVGEARAREVARLTRERAEAARRLQAPAVSKAWRERVASLEPEVALPGSDATLFSLGTLKPEGSIDFQHGVFEFGGGRVRSAASGLGKEYTVSFWFRNDLPNEARSVTAYLWSRGPDGVGSAPGGHLGIGGTFRGDQTGRLIFFNGNESNQVVIGKTRIEPQAWYHIVLVRDGPRIRVWLDGALEMDAEIPQTSSEESFFFGARSDGFAPLKGFLMEPVVCFRALDDDEIHLLQPEGKR